MPLRSSLLKGREQGLEFNITDVLEHIFRHDPINFKSS